MLQNISKNTQSWHAFSKMISDALRRVFRCDRRRRAVRLVGRGRFLSWIKRESSSFGGEPSRRQRHRRLTDVLIQKTVKTMEVLSSLLHANPHVSIRDSLNRGEDIPLRPTGFKHLLCLHSAPLFAPNWEEAILLCFLLRNDASRSSLCRYLPPIVQIKDKWFDHFSLCSGCLRVTPRNWYDSAVCCGSSAGLRDGIKRYSDRYCCCNVIQD